MLERPTKMIKTDYGTFVLRRPGFTQLLELNQQLVQSTSDALGPNLAILDSMGHGIEVHAVLSAYVVEAPDGYMKKGRLALDDMDPEFVLDVLGEEALAFHRSFREVDAKLRRSKRQDP